MSLILSDPLLARLQVDPTFTEDGSLATCVVQAFFGRDLVDTDTDTRMPQPWGAPVLIDCVAYADKTVTYDGVTYTYGELARAMAAAAMQEAMKEKE